MAQFYTRDHYEAAATFIKSQTGHHPDVGIILGSGLNPLAEAVEEADRIGYDQVPFFPKATVEGHSGQIVLGKLADTTVLILQGRAHFYEGYSMPQVVFPVRAMQVMGIKTLIVTNAAGGLDPAYRPGELMLIRDHINLVGMAGANPLFGPNDLSLGPRFPDMSMAYDSELRALARQVAHEQDIPLHEGVYVGLAGPSFETPADIRFLRMIGADAVGMSTVAEVTVARHGGLRVLGVSNISNVVLSEPMAGQQTSHEEVLAAGRQAVPRLMALLLGVLARLGGS